MSSAEYREKRRLSRLFESVNRLINGKCPAHSPFAGSRFCSQDFPHPKHPHLYWASHGPYDRSRHQSCWENNQVFIETPGRGYVEVRVSGKNLILMERLIIGVDLFEESYDLGEVPA
jgi:hypothetical protein